MQALSAAEQFSIKTAKLEFIAANDRNYSKTKIASSGFLSSTTKTTVLSSNLKANNLSLSANSEDKNSGNIDITGSNVTANEALTLNSSNNVTIKEAKDTEQSRSKEQTGKAEIKATIKNEYEQIAYAIEGACK